jgi:hypothetical protein
LNVSGETKQRVVDKADFKETVKVLATLAALTLRHETLERQNNKTGGGDDR